MLTGIKQSTIRVSSKYCAYATQTQSFCTINLFIAFGKKLSRQISWNSVWRRNVVKG